MTKINERTNEKYISLLTNVVMTALTNVRHNNCNDMYIQSGSPKGAQSKILFHVSQ